ncbi:MAG: aminotransferase class I/II-fold pyridoxal phosphate-dependent enzyme [Actinobacteria bacterium]|nr:aminotransferase class I/II-fold pyridoxal phosphate-dependent enzyme [Actinomycetota bacterium]
MRDLGHWLVDRVVDHFERGGEGPAIRTGTPQDLMAALGGPVPRAPGDPLAELRTLADVALSHMQHGDHPRYFARVPGPSSFAGVLGDWLGTGFNAIATSWAGGSGPAAVELVVLGWLGSLLGLSPAADGVITSGGSIANLTALVAARDATGPGVFYLSDQAHESIDRALRAIGVPEHDVRVLASDRDLRLPPDAVAAAVSEDRARGRRPGFVVATAGTVNAGAVDPLPALAELCRREDLWLHVDGAYGAPAALCDAGRAALRGLELADSLTLDPHKWLFQPYDAGCLFVQRPGALEAAFAFNPEYLVDTVAGAGEVNFRDRSLELTRRSRALKLWLTFRTYGADRIATAIARGLALAEHAEQRLHADDRWRVVTPAQLGIVTFELPGATPTEHRRRAAALAADGHAVVTSTEVHGRPVLRLCTINPRTTEADIDSTIERLATVRA